MNLFVSNTSSNIKNIKLPWVEKYRPKELDEILLDDFIKIKIKKILEEKSIPNMILTGEPSTGKTSTILFLAKHIYCSSYDDLVLELNASDDRGLSIISNKIYPFCKKNTTNYDINKLIILDEADSITIKAQNLLSNIISVFRNTTRFIFICNDSNQIVESIQSKCILIKYPKISYLNFYNKIKYICDNEKVPYDDNGIKSLIYVSNYDIRQAINNLECLFFSYNLLSEDTIYKIIDKPKPYYIYNILKECYNKQLLNAIKIVKSLYDKGYSPSDILLSFTRTIFDYDNKEFDIEELSEESKLEICDIINKSYIKINQGLDTLLQLCGCISKIYKYINKL